MNEVYQKAEVLKRKPFFGNVRQILKDPVGFLGRLPADYGPVVKAGFAGKTYFILQHPDYIKHVLLDNHKGYSKPGATKLLGLFLGEGLITSNGEVWYKKRRLMQPSFHKQRVGYMLDIINEETTACINKLDSLPPGAPVNISNELLQLNISIIGRALFSTALKEEMETMVKALDELTGYASAWMKSIIKIPVDWPTPANRNFKNNCRVFDSIIYSIIDRRRKYRADPGMAAHDDLLDMLLDYLDQDTNDAMTEKQLRDEVTTMFMAGQETTSQTLSWIFYHVAKEKGILKKIQEETSNILSASLPEPGDLSKLVYTRQVIQEGMRCYPAVCALVRQPYQDDEIRGIKIPVSAKVLINIYGIHHHPQYWNNPFDFDPGRFAVSPQKEHSPFVYLPFGSGPRLCIGNNFAMMIMQVVVSRVSRHFEMELLPGYVASIETNITLRPKEGVQLLVWRRPG